MKRISIVIGLGYGDEGKGNVVNGLLNYNQKNTLVVRFNGGNQVTHTVYKDGKGHVFSNFGSGTMKNVPTLYTADTLMDPLSYMGELEILQNKGIEPIVYFDVNAKVITPYDVFANRMQMRPRSSTGNGINATLKREEAGFQLRVIDLFYPDILAIKLRNIGRYYNLPTIPAYKQKAIIDRWLKAALQFKKLKSVHLVHKPNLNNIENFIFEGAQGIMLDKAHGYFPNVTPTDTTSKLVWKFLKDIDLTDDVIINMLYVTRAYATRHGVGYLMHEKRDSSFISDNPYESNVRNSYQGEFRKAILDYKTLEYAITVDNLYIDSSINIHTNLVVTCLDLVHKESDDLFIMRNNTVLTYDVFELSSKLKCDNAIPIRNPEWIIPKILHTGN